MVTTDVNRPAALVCVIGSANLDLVARAARIPRPGETVMGYDYFEAAGGKGLNQAVAAARSGADVSFLAALGTDGAADALISVAEAEGISTAAVRRVAGPTGRALISVGDDGENSIVVVPGANTSLDARHIRIHGPTVARAQVVLAQLEVPIPAVIAAFEVARAVGATTVLNPAPAIELPDELLALVDVLIPNEHEADTLGGITHLRQLGIHTIIVTEGPLGCRLFTGGGEERIAPFEVVAIDTTAAGDSFCGSLCARLAIGEPIRRALVWANAAGALATTVTGAVPSIPRAAAIEELISVRG